MEIFIADDNPLQRMNLRITLNQARDIKVIGEAGDGISAIEKIKVHPPDIVLIDIDMPRLSGIGATRILRKEIPRLKIIINSISGDEDRICHAYKAGADAYVLKSVEDIELIGIIRDVYAGHKIVALPARQPLGFWIHKTC